MFEMFGLFVIALFNIYPFLEDFMDSKYVEILSIASLGMSLGKLEGKENVANNALIPT